MRQAVTQLALISCLAASAVPRQAHAVVQRPQRSTPGGKRLALNSMRLPVVFEQNAGQAPEQVRFIVRKLDHTVFFLRNEVVFSARGRSTVERGRDIQLANRGDIVTMQFVDAGGEGPQVGEAMKARATYVGGRDGRIALSLAASIAYRGLYAGIDLRFRNAGGRLRYEFSVTPKANVGAIRLRFRGARRIRIDENGGLVVDAGNGAVRHSAPIVYAIAGSSQRRVQGRFVVLSSTDVTIRVVGVRPGESIHIDPELSYSTYLGGTESVAAYGNLTYPVVSAYGTNVDIYFQTASAGFPGASAVTQSEFSAVLYRFDCQVPASPTMVFAVVFPSSMSGKLSMQSASDGSVYVLSQALAGDPLAVPGDAIQPAPDSPYPPFLARVESNGTVQRMTYLWSLEGPRGVAVEAGGASPGVYVTGSVGGFFINMASLPTYMQNPVHPPRANDYQEVVVLKLDLSLRQVQYVTFFGGSNQDWGEAIDVKNGKAEVLAGTSSVDYPVTPGAYQAALVPYLAPKTFLTGLDVSGAIVHSGVLGYFGRAIEIASSGELVTGPFDRSYGGPALVTDAIKLSSGGTSLAFQTPDIASLGYDIAADNLGGLWICGDTRTPGLATPGAVQPNMAGLGDGFVALYSPTGTLSYWTYLGGSGGDAATSIARVSDVTYLAGLTTSPDFPGTTAAFQPNLNGVFDAFLAILNAAPVQVVVTKQGSPSQINENGHVMYTVQVTNTGTASLSGLAIVDQADAPLVVLAPQWQTTGTWPNWTTVGGNAYKSDNVTLVSGQSVTFTVEAVGVSQGAYQNCASVLSGTTLLGSTCSSTDIVGEAHLAISVDDDVIGTVPQNTPVNFTVTVTNLGTEVVSNVQVHHLALNTANTSPFVFTAVNSADPGTFLDANFGDADGYTWVFNSIAPMQAGRLFVTTRPDKVGRRQTQATATVTGASGGPWTAISTTDIGHVVEADIGITVTPPAAASSNRQVVSVDVNNLTPLVTLPAFGLDVELSVVPTTFPQADLATPDGTSAAQAAWIDQGTSGGVAKWVAAFNVRAGFTTGTAKIWVPNTVTIQAIRAFVAQPDIIDANGAEAIWP